MSLRRGKRIDPAKVFFSSRTHLYLHIQDITGVAGEYHFFGVRAEFEVVQQFDGVDLIAPGAVGAEKAVFYAERQYEFAVLLAGKNFADKSEVKINLASGKKNLYFFPLLP